MIDKLIKWILKNTTRIVTLFASIAVFMIVYNVIKEVADRKWVKEKCKIDIENFSTVTRSGHPGDTLKKDTIR